MKVFIPTIMVIIILSLSACNSADYEEDIYIVSDRFFATQMHNIQADYPNFLGRTIQYTGIFVSDEWNGETLYFVIRFDQDCCTPGDTMGLEVYLNDINPVDDFTWVRITGVLEELNIPNFERILRVAATHIEIVEEPGE